MNAIITDIEKIIEHSLDDFVSMLVLYIGSNMEDGGNTGGQNKTDILRVQSGKLLQSFEKGTKLQFSNGMIDGEISSDVPYAAIHEYGGFIKSKGKMANFFLMMFIKTKDVKWLKFRSVVLKNGGITMKPRPYFIPAVNEMNEKGKHIWWESVIDDINLYFLR